MLWVVWTYQRVQRYYPPACVPGEHLLDMCHPQNLPLSGELQDKQTGLFHRKTGLFSSLLWAGKGKPAQHSLSNYYDPMGPKNTTSSESRDQGEALGWQLQKPGHQLHVKALLWESTKLCPHLPLEVSAKDYNQPSDVSLIRNLPLSYDHKL